MRHGTRQLFGDRVRHGARHPDTGMVLHRHVAGFYSAVDTPSLWVTWNRPWSGLDRLATPSFKYQQSLAPLASIRRSRLRTVETCQTPPRRVVMPRQSSSRAIWRKEVCPAARISQTISARSAAWRSAFLLTAPRSAAAPSAARRRAAAPFGLPSRTPRALATARASLVRREIASR